jgi:hypothetical protein
LEQRRRKNNQGNIVSMISVEDFIKKQIALSRAYDFRSEKLHRTGRGEQRKISFGPYLLISREKGAGGSAVGEISGRAPRLASF